jgi:hypothetical protein
MGIRGAWSLLSKEPNRFGDSWESNAKLSVIWIDGPSLVYFLALQPKFEDLNFLRSDSCVQVSQLGQASPSSIHLRTKNFISVLCRHAKEIHVVMDGISHQSKMTTKLARMKNSAEHAEETVSDKGYSPCCKVISILAEWTMVHTIEKLRAEFHQLSLHRPVEGEAEHFINMKLCDCSHLSNVAIMSSDTDFLIYPNCPGFIPLSSLQFSIDDCEKISITGFQYSSFRYLMAYFNGQRDDRLLTTVAALSGCDYDNEILEVARVKIFRSSIAGLKIKHQNKPSAALALKAVLRYVAYYWKKETSWLEALVNSLDGNHLLTESLNEVHSTYFPDKVDRMLEKRETSLECLRLYQGTFYCQPLLEKGGSLNCQLELSTSQVPLIRLPRKAKRKGEKFNFIHGEHINSKIEFCAGKVMLSTSHLSINDLHPKFDLSELRILLRRQSMWNLSHFQFFRKLLFSIMNAHEAFDFRMIEWRKVGRGKDCFFKAFEVEFIELSLESLSNPRTSESVLFFNLVSLRTVEIARMLLPDDTHWLWMLLVSSPTDLCSKGYRKQVSNCKLDPMIFNLFTLAYFHANLVKEVLSSRLQCENLTFDQTSSCEIFERLDDKIGGWIWDLMQGWDKSSSLPNHIWGRINPGLSLSLKKEWESNLGQFSL